MGPLDLFDPDDERIVVEHIVCSTHPYPGMGRLERAESSGDLQPDQVCPYTWDTSLPQWK